MGNTITHDCYPEVEALSMSNGLTEVLFSTMSMATGLLATSPWEVRVARWWCAQDQASPFAAGFGFLDFDLDELGWTAEEWPEQRRFLLDAIRFARAGARWLVSERINFEFLHWALAGLHGMVEVIDARILDPRPPSPVAVDRVDLLEGVDGAAPEQSTQGACLIHGCYLHSHGCIACYTLNSDAIRSWPSTARRKGPPPDAPWLVAARDGIPVRRHRRMATRRSFEPHVLASLRPTRGPWKAAYDHVLAAFDADPFGLIATTRDRYAYELEARHYVAEWASGRKQHPVELLASILTTSFASAPRYPGRLGRVLQHLQRLDESLLGLAPRTTPAPPRPTLWPRTPDLAALSRLAPPPPKKGHLALARATVFPELGEEVIGFIRTGRDWMSHVYLGPPDAAARVTLRVERPLQWVSAGWGDPNLAYPGSGVQLTRQRMPLSEVSPWLHQSHIHLVLLGPEDRALRVFQLPVAPEPSASTFDDPTGEAQLAALRAGRIQGDAKVAVEIAAGRVDHETHPFARLQHLRELEQVRARAQAELDRDAIPQVVRDLLDRLDRLLDEGRLGDVTGFGLVLPEEFGPHILVKLVLAHAELRGGPNQHTHALALLWGLVDPPDEPE